MCFLLFVPPKHGCWSTACLLDVVTWHSFPERTHPKCGNFLPMPSAWKRAAALWSSQTVNQAMQHSGKFRHGLVTLFLHSWRNGVIISYELNCFCQMCLASTCGLDASMWPCPGRKGCKALISWVWQPRCVCNNKTSELDALRGWDYVGLGSVPWGCHIPSYLKFFCDQLSKELWGMVLGRFQQLTLRYPHSSWDLNLDLWTCFISTSTSPGRLSPHYTLFFSYVFIGAL